MVVRHNDVTGTDNSLSSIIVHAVAEGIEFVYWILIRTVNTASKAMGQSASIRVCIRIHDFRGGTNIPFQEPVL
jgi:hypothetical protein